MKHAHANGNTRPGPVPVMTAAEDLELAEAMDCTVEDLKSFANNGGNFATLHTAFQAAQDQDRAEAEYEEGRPK